jgi:transcriptional regulator with XRE-family HTH domain
MFDTPAELARALGQQIRTRRLALGWTQADAASRAGVSYSTWRRLERDGRASIDDLVRAAIALRCEERLKALFPVPAASSMDELLEQQRNEARPRRSRSPRRAS